MSSNIKLRTYIFIDSLQPQLAEYLGTTSQGFLPIPGDASLWIEIAPGMAIHRLTDAALKATNVRLGAQVVERSFGTLEVHSDNQGEDEGLVVRAQIERPEGELQDLIGDPDQQARQQRTGKAGQTSECRSQDSPDERTEHEGGL